jgi:hypothetical protein
MNKFTTTQKLIAAVFVVGLFSGCASTNRVTELEARLDEVSATANNAQSTADQALAAANAADAKASQAAADAAAAMRAAEEAKSLAAAADAKADRMFQKSMTK